MSNKPYARKLAEFAAGATFSDLPKEVVHQARRCLLDTVGVIIAGSAMADSSKAIQKFVKKMAPQGKASVIGTSQKMVGRQELRQMVEKLQCPYLIPCLHRMVQIKKAPRRFLNLRARSIRHDLWKATS